jgi:hypothetical protein
MSDALGHCGATSPLRDNAWTETLGLWLRVLVW